ncbi:sulfotransferase [Lacinutrix jangbogonensis]|uniref:sulfotransferase n=1 Tax=Lacinutrix jangbogonensis TaxID=1469557 RepID=UPI00053DAA5D|nr:sulfotransferase [Lacinutrix jangbogonensis]
MSQKQTIIFSNSYSPRTGHNFASEALKVFTDHEVLAHARSETRLSNFLKGYKELYNSIHFKSDRDFFDTIILNDIRSNIIKHSESNYILIKNTSFEGVKHIPEVFPDDIHILLLRDPIDTFNSLFKAMNLNKMGHKYWIKKIGKVLGVYPYYFCRKVSMQIIKDLPDFSKFYVVKYEDLVKQNITVLEALKKKFNTPKSIEQIIEELSSIKVINSSFFEETGAKGIWESKEITKGFNPINRKKNSFLIRTGIALGAKELKSKLGY